VKTEIEERDKRIADLEDVLKVLVTKGDVIKKMEARDRGIKLLAVNRFPPAGDRAAK